MKLSKNISAAILAGIVFLLPGCAPHSEDTLDENSEITREARTASSDEEELCSAALEAGSLCEDIASEALKNGTADTLKAREAVVSCLGQNGFCAADTENQINMVNADRMEAFCQAAGNGKSGQADVILVMDAGSFVYYRFRTQDGAVDVQRCTFSQDTDPKVGYYEAFTAEDWSFTQRGYFFFSQYRMPGFDGPPRETGIRIISLSRDCRELTRKYAAPVGYSLNNMLITDWSEADGYGALNFYDMYDIMYEMKYGTVPPYPYTYTGSEYEIPEQEFEDVLQTYLSAGPDTIRAKTVYHADSGTYQYRPRGLDDAEGLYGPYPEVTSWEEQPDGTLKLTVAAVWITEFDDQAITSELVVRPLEDGGFQYVSNHVIETKEGISGKWHSPRLTEEEWNRIYGLPSS